MSAAAVSKASLAGLAPSEIRQRIRTGAYRGDSWALAPGYAQTAMVALPRAIALDFMIFAQRNPRPCPVLEVTDPGNPLLADLAPGADVRTDLGRYRVFVNGQCVDEPDNVEAIWTDEMMAFAIGCTGSFEQHIVKCGIPLRHLDEGKVVPVFVTNRQCVPAGRLRAPLAVSMRPVRQADISRVVELTSRFPAFHGSPIHVGDPDALGVDLENPDYGDRLTIEDHEVPVFWACSVTPQLMAIASVVELMITNFPAYMFLTDVPTERMAVVA